MAPPAGVGLGSCVGVTEAVGVWVGGRVGEAVGVCVAVALLVARRLLGGRCRPAVKGEPDLAIDVMALPTVGPPPGGPHLAYFDVPVRLAAVVLAPSGRIRELPPLNKMNEVFDSIVPGLSGVIAAHRPVYRKWPPQLSVRGFAHMFFGHAQLPGQGGKGTPWCSAAGLFKVDGQVFMAGLVMRAETTTNLGQRIIEEEAQWLDILRIKA